METLIASGIELGSSALEPRTPVPRAVVEIGPYDLPEPPGGWIDLVLDDDGEDDEEDAAACGAAAELRAPAAAGAEAGSGPATSSLAVPSPQLRGDPAGAPAARRWFLVPEALVVAGFVLFGALFLGAVVVLRAPGEPAAPRGSVSAPVEVTDPALGSAHRRGRGASPASRAGREALGAASTGEAETAPAGVAPPSDVEAPPGADSPIDPQSPPSPVLAPWGDGG